MSQWPKWLRRQYGKLEICGSSPGYDTNFSLKNYHSEKCFNVNFVLAGELDEETSKTMSLPRCGVKDKVGAGSDSRSKRYALQGMYCYYRPNDKSGRNDVYNFFQLEFYGSTIKLTICILS